MSLGARLVTGFLLVTLLLVAPGLYLLGLLDRLEREQTDLVEIGLGEVARRARVRRHLDSIDEFTRKYFVLRDRAYGEELERLRSEVEDDLGELARGAESAAGTAARVAGLADAWRRYRETAAREPAREEPQLAALAAARVELEALDDTAAAGLEERLAAAHRAAERARALAVVAGTVAVASALIIVGVVTRAVTRPIADLTRGAKAVADENYAVRVSEEGPPELAALGGEFNRMAERLRQLDALKRELVSNVSHDLKAPLASMQETTRLLLEGGVGELTAAQRKMLRLNLESGERLSAMISELLDMARLEAGAVEYALSDQDLAELAGEVADGAAGLVERRRQRLRRDLAARVVARVDRALVTQALWNLVANAVRFTPEGGELGLALRVFATGAELAGEYPRAPTGPVPAAALEVWDTGPGVADEEKARIFERFRRGSAAESGGTGLGLAIARRIAADHGGALWVEDRVGGGSRFVLLLASRRGAEAGSEAAA